MAKKSIAVELDEETMLRLAVLGDPARVLEQLAFAAAEGVRRPDYSKRIQTDESLQSERDTSDAHFEKTRVADREETDEALQNERDGTDRGLRGERAQADTALLDQREANAAMVSATIRAQELADVAEEARRRAESSEQSLREVAEFRELFIGILGHDLRTPLNTIVMASGLLIAHGFLKQEDVRLAGRIVNAAQRMKRMITQLLDLTRARLGGGFPLERTHTDMRAVCQIVAEEFETAVDVQIEGDVTGSWDPDRLVELLSNLASNGVEYGAPGTTVVVRAYPEAADVIVEVRNQGAPIPADVLPYLFEPFRRAQPKKKSAAGNLGIGLYIAHQIVLSHGGTLEAHSADGTTSFVTRLPRTPRG